MTMTGTVTPRISKRSVSVHGQLAAIFVFLFAGQTLAATCLETDPVAIEWLQKMSHSSHVVNYRGVVTFQRGDDMQVMQIAHSVSGDSATESLTRLTGQGAQVLRSDHPLECIHPGHKLLRLGLNKDGGECGIAQHYRIEVGDGERVAGRDSVRVKIEPRDMYRYGYVMELDRETALLLKVSTVGRGARILERFQFADLTYGQEQHSAVPVETVHLADHPVPSQPGTSRTLGVAWEIKWLPSGFMPTDSSEQADGRRTYTDGLAVFSVFLEPLRGVIKPGEGVARQGSTISYTRGMSLSGAPVLVTVIGEVPVNTARMVADSISRLK
ncbi:MAG: sigma-E factor negative regulatory protein RseB [Halieaceae bacterium]|jgi:sigma-E factor negative regulatory protein RseB